MTFTLEEQLEIIKMGTVEILPEEGLVKKLERSIRENKPLRVKQGFDPTAPDLHLGHTVTIRKLRQFQDLGHQVIFLIGDFTGMIGDPSGEMEARKRLTREEVLKNAETYKEQIFKVLDPDKTTIDFNSRWLSKMGFEDVLVLASKYTVARLLERDDFYKRYREGRPISLLEFLYPLTQGYDSVALKADVELGGTDQRFNLLVGRELQREYGQEPQVVVTMPLLEGTDGVEKMSKSKGNHIGINEPPDEIYGKVMSIPDHLILKYFELVTDVAPKEFQDLERLLDDPETNPRDLKRRLARDIVRLCYDQRAALDAEERFDQIFRRKEVPEDVAEYRVKKRRIRIIELLTETGMAKSNLEAKRLISPPSGVYVDGKRIEDPNFELVIDGAHLLKVGKRRFLKIVPASGV